MTDTVSLRSSAAALSPRRCASIGYDDGASSPRSSRSADGSPAGARPKGAERRRSAECARESARGRQVEWREEEQWQRARWEEAAAHWREEEEGGEQWVVVGEEEAAAAWTAEETQWCARLLQFCARENADAAEGAALVAAVDEWQEALRQRPARALEKRLEEQSARAGEWPPFILRW